VELCVRLLPTCLADSDGSDTVMRDSDSVGVVSGEARGVGDGRLSVSAVSTCLLTSLRLLLNMTHDNSQSANPLTHSRVHSVLEKSLKMLEFGIKTSRPLKVLENR